MMSRRSERGIIEHTSSEEQSNNRIISMLLDRSKHLLRHLAYNMGRLTYHSLHTANTNGIRYPGALNFDISKQGGLVRAIYAHTDPRTLYHPTRSPCPDIPEGRWQFRTVVLPHCIFEACLPPFVSRSITKRGTAVRS